MIHRFQTKAISKFLFKKKAIIVYGARQVGKTSLLKELASPYSYLWMNGDEPDIQELLKNITSARLKTIIGKNKILVIDEAQRVENIGLLIKRMVDSFPEIQVIASGSSAFELADKIKESMVGRKVEFQMFPFTFAEMVSHSSFVEENRLLAQRLIYGYYPEVVTNPGNESMILEDLSEAFMFKDVLNLDGIKKSATLYKLVQHLAYRIGSEISTSSLATEIGINRITIEKYIDILEKNFIIFTLSAYSNNLDNEIKKGKKIYFWDLGLRNRLIRNLSPIESRNDIGALWENYIVSERKKKLKYDRSEKDLFFWRNTQQAEIDLIEIENKKMEVFEIKYNPKQKAKFTKTFINHYKPKVAKVINNENYTDWLL